MWSEVERHRQILTATGEFARRRREQQVAWMWSMLEERLMLSLRSNPQLRDRLAALEAAVAAGETAASLAVARSQYAAGAGTYLNVLTAEQSDFSARLSLITARAARFTDTVALFQALGGGWWNRTDVDAKVARCCGVFP